MAQRQRDWRAPRVRAILGPTNTGKTHQAIERMLGHRSGMIGLPLRLLAREVYDRVVERRGPDAVALVTGEEKRVPADPQYFVCTVEAMPVDRMVAFLAVDEIQLAGDRNRGHTFTDRILNARGVEETLFLGAATIAPLLERLIPDIVIESAPRLSKLSWAGTKKLSSVPPRSAIVAFSAEAVYEAAERLRAVHGGTAVVLGALSPRTRNAQVAMYQAGEVKHIVATDAIGMGLNMDIHHVAFSAVRKFDGRGHRDLSTAELAQIAGRAGRYRTDGTFGTTREVGDLPEDVIAAVENHEFPPLSVLFWRNSDLDFDSPRDLVRSLERPPPAKFLVPALTEDDQQVLQTLIARDDVLALVKRPEALVRLWEICKVPDYHKTRTDAHGELLGQMALHLLGPNGALPDAFVEHHVARLARTDGDIETLMSRIAWIRTWTYVAWQRDWTSRPAHFQEWTRSIEDSLSDALHERLTARFVDRRTLVALGPVTDQPVVWKGDTVEIGGIVAGTVRDWSFVPPERQVADTAPSKVAQSAMRRRVRSEIVPRLDALEAATDEEIVLDDDGRLVWSGVGLARLSAGPGLLEPKVVLARLDLLEPPERERVRRVIEPWRDRWVASLFAPLDRPAASRLSALGKGIVYAVRTALGTVDRSDVEGLLSELGADERTALAKLDLRIGTYTVFVQSLLRQEPMRIRGALWSLARNRVPLARPPANGRPTLTPPDGAGEREALRAMGYRGFGGLAVRVDVLERVAAEVRTMARSPEPVAIDTVTSWLGSTRDEALAVIRALGFQVRDEPDGRIRLRRQQ